MRGGTVGILAIVVLITMGSFVLFYHGADQVLRLGLTHTLILSGDDGPADFVAGSDLPIYISGYHTFDVVGEEVDFTVTLYDSEGAYLAHADVYLNSPGSFVETLSYHETIDYTLTPGEQYTIEVAGHGFGGNIEQPHSPLAEWVLHAFYMGEVIGIVFLAMAVSWVCIIVGLCGAGIDEVKTRRAKNVPL
ncbi:MAG: hypothetical protein EAX95_15610 [Candidatus Thorarchaeota archaeon]|nr:hypothetical protein [Candidatus Thorarchaeota archaeon]